MKKEIQRKYRGYIPIRKEDRSPLILMCMCYSEIRIREYHQMLIVWLYR